MARLTMASQLSAILDDSLKETLVAPLQPHAVSLKEALTGASISMTTAKRCHHHLPIPDEVRQQAHEDIDEEGIAAELRELEETGGLELHEFIQELEDMVAREHAR